MEVKNLDISDKPDYQIRLGGKLYTVLGNVPVQTNVELQELAGDATHEKMAKMTRIIWDKLIAPVTPNGSWDDFWGAMTLAKMGMLFEAVVESQQTKEKTVAPVDGGEGKNVSGAQRLTE